MEPELTPGAAATALKQIDALDRRRRRDRPAPSLPLVILAAVIVGAIPFTRTDLSSAGVLTASVFQPVLSLYWLISLPTAYLVIHLTSRAQAGRRGIWASRSSLTVAGVAGLAVLVCLVLVGPALSIVLPGDLVLRGFSPLFTVVAALAIWAREEHSIPLRLVALAELVVVLVADLYDPENVTDRFGWTFWDQRGPVLALLLVAVVPLVAAGGFALHGVLTRGR